jgi:hypothetical protein
MDNTLDLSLEPLDDIEAPLSDMEWGGLAGAAFAGGVLIGIAIT